MWSGSWNILAQCTRNTESLARGYWHAVAVFLRASSEHYECGSLNRAQLETHPGRGFKTHVEMEQGKRWTPI